MGLRSPVRWALSALGLAAAAACDLGNPAGALPAAIRPPSQPESRAESTLIGTYSVPTAMPLPGQRTSYAEHAPTGIPLAPNSYVLLRVGGTLQAVRNPYILDTKPGDGPISYSAFESYEATARGATHLWLLGSGGTWVPPAGGEILTGYFRPDPGDARDMILLVRVGPTPAQLWSHRDPLPGRQLYYYCFEIYPYCRITEEGTFARPGENNGQWIENYWLQQSHTVTATAIAEPLTVDGPDAVAPGDTATFTATPWGSLRLRNQVGIRPRVWWIWYPNDTTAVPNPKVRPEVLFCRDQSCPFAPAQSGRLRVQTFVEGAPVEAERFLRVQQQRLELKCNAQLDRGDDLRCTASANPAGVLDSIRWEFADSAGHTIQGPAGATFWEGRMVVGGTMRVTARLNGLPVTEDTTITVHARRWKTIRLRVRQHPYPAGHLPAPANVTAPGHLGDSHADSLTTLSVREITAGPNTGWWYVDQPVIEFGFVVHINEAAFATGSAWYNLQTGGDYVLPSGVKVPNGRCDSSHIPTMRQLAREHEGLASSSLTSHADAAQVYLNTQRPQDILEAQIAFGPDLIGYNFYQGAYATYVGIASSMEAFAAPHTNDAPPGIVDRAPFPCYARPWHP